jgi:hypothetical protein
VEAQPAGAAISDDAILATGIDHHRVAGVRRFQPHRHAIRRIVVEVGKAFELRLCLRGEGRLWMRSKQMVAALPKPLERIGPSQAVEVSDAAAPIREVEVVLGPAVSQ